MWRTVSDVALELLERLNEKLEFLKKCYCVVSCFQEQFLSGGILNAVRTEEVTNTS